MSENKDGGGFGGLVDKAKDALSGQVVAGKAKEILSDERIDQVADAIKKVTPDSIDRKIDTVADKAKDLND